MGTLAQLEKAGLSAQFEAHLNSFFVKGPEKEKFRSVVDQVGLQAKQVLDLIGQYQRTNAMKPGSWPGFVSLSASLAAAGNGAKAATTASVPAVAQPATPTAPVAEVAEVVGAEAVPTEKKARRPRLSIEERIAQKVLEEEAAFKSRMAAMEMKMREKSAGKVSSSVLATRTPEVAQRYREIKASLSEKRATVKTLHAEIKALMAEEVAIVPKRARAKKGEGKSGKVEANPAMQQQISAYLASAQNSSAKLVAGFIGVDRALVSAQIKLMRQANLIVKHGEGLSTTYSLA